MVQLTVQPPPQPGAPIMSAAPLNLNFSSTQGQPNPQGQVVTITNTGGSALYWSRSVTQIVSSWLNASPTGGIIQRGQTGQLVVSVDTAGLSPGSYAGQITLNAQAPASGGGEVVSVNLVVQPPVYADAALVQFAGLQWRAGRRVSPGTNIVDYRHWQLRVATDLKLQRQHCALAVCQFLER